FNFNDFDALSSIIINLLDNPEKLEELRHNALEYGRKITWPKIGKKYAILAEQILKNKKIIIKTKESILDPLILPPFSLIHIKRLTDDTGIIQHAKFAIPNLKDGYCLDDNARALLMTLMAYKQKKDTHVLELCTIYLSFILYMQNNDGTFRNFMNFRREYLDETGSEDSFGRTVWALGYLLNNAPNDASFQSAKDLFFNALPNFIKLNSVRSIAFTLIGISHYLKRMSSDENLIRILKILANKLVVHYETNKTDKWKWFEPLLSYDNAILPLSLFHTYEIIGDRKIKKIAFESLNFLSDITLNEGYLSVIGNEKWYNKDGERSVYAQQPVDASAMVLMFHQAYMLTKDIKYLEKLYASFMWFLGENDLRMNLYDFETNGCCDGLERNGVNRNQGAESTLSYLISHLTVLQAFEDFHEIK
ncbi:MAG: glycosyl transferase, partial [Bacteroidales bacterium]|nr:glycosyl transferase [Bacteroidales bacterium]